MANQIADVAFDVEDVGQLCDSIRKRGGEILSPPETISDSYGQVRVAKVRTYGETTHTLVERTQYKGPFLPGYRSETVEDPLSSLLPTVLLENIDHCVGNVDWNAMEDVCK
jgi:4-hydroxyphenylpyruvate dioxygenase